MAAHARKNCLVAMQSVSSAVLSGEGGAGTADCPWSVSVQRGQRVNVSVTVLPARTPLTSPRQTATQSCWHTPRSRHHDTPTSTTTTTSLTGRFYFRSLEHYTVSQKNSAPTLARYIHHRHHHHLVRTRQHNRNYTVQNTTATRAQHLLRWATVPEQSGLKSGGGAAVSISVGESWVPVQHNVVWDEAYLRTKWHLDPSNHLATIHRFRETYSTDNGPTAYGRPKMIKPTIMSY